MPNQDGHNPLKRDNPFQLHYFPEIPLGKPLATTSRATTTDCFKRFCDVDRDAAEPQNESDQTSPLQSSDPTCLTPEDIEKQAYNRGFSKGEKAGLAAAAVKLEATLSVLTRAIDEVRKLRSAVYSDAEKEVVELSLAIARKLIQREVQTDRQAVVDAVRSALAKVDDYGSITIKMNPADYRFLQHQRDHIADWADDRITFKEDACITEGGCLLETDRGDIDARLDSRLQVVADAMRSELRRTKEAD